MLKCAKLETVVRFFGNGYPRSHQRTDLLPKLFKEMIVLIAPRQPEYLLEYEPYSPDTRCVILVQCIETDTILGWVDATPSKSPRTYIR